MSLTIMVANEDVVGILPRIDQYIPPTSISYFIENFWCIAHAESHYEVFVIAILGCEGCLFDIHLVNPYLVVPGA